MNMKIPLHPDAKALIFDLDGTLVDSMDVHFSAWQIVAQEYGFSLSRDSFYRLAGMPTAAIIALLAQQSGCSINVAEATERKERLFLKNLSKVKPNGIVVEMVHQHHGRLPMAIGTGGRRVVAEATLAFLGLTSFFETIVTAEEVMHHKPDPETFLQCAARMNIDPSCCQVLEDGEPGFRAARSAGMILTDVRSWLLP